MNVCITNTELFLYLVLFSCCCSDRKSRLLDFTSWTAVHTRLPCPSLEVFLVMFIESMIFECLLIDLAVYLCIFPRIDTKY